MMAIMEMKFPMLKHPWATSIKNSSMRVWCFFFTILRAARQPQGEPTVRASLHHPSLKGRLDRSHPGPSVLSDPGLGRFPWAAEAGNAAVASPMLGKGAGEQSEITKGASPR